MGRDAGQVSLSDIEAGLERLMPRGLSDSAQEELELAVDDLAGGSLIIPVWKRSLGWPSAVAALVVIAFGGAYVVKQGIASPIDSRLALVADEGAKQRSGIEVRGQTTWIESGVALGVQALDDSGDISRGWSYSGVEEERVFHENSGYEVILQRGFEAEFHSMSSL